jgi:acyl dehydratase
VNIPIDDLAGAVGRHLGFSSWVEIDAEAVERFARATRGVAGGTVEPYLLLSLTNRLFPEIMQVPDAGAGVNYGAARVTFPDSVAVGAKVRAGAEMVAVEPVAGGVQTTVRITVEAAGAGPVCVVDSLSRWLR